MTAHRRGAALHASTADLEELSEAVAAEANHEPNRRRQRRLDDAFDAWRTLPATCPPAPVTRWHCPNSTSHASSGGVRQECPTTRCIRFVLNASSRQHI